MHQDLDELKIKIILLGDHGVGKTSIIDCIHKGPGDRQTIMTTGPEYICERIVIDSIHIKVSVWDTAGQEKYRAINRGFYKQNKGAFIVFDLTDPVDEEEVYYWIKELKEHAEKKVKIVFLANKVDLSDEPEENFLKLKAIADKEGYEIFMTSAKSGLGVQEAFYSLVKSVKDTFHADFKPESKKNNVRLSTKESEHDNVSISTCC